MTELEPRKLQRILFYQDWVLEAFQACTILFAIHPERHLRVKILAVPSNAGFDGHKNQERNEPHNHQF